MMKFCRSFVLFVLVSRVALAASAHAAAEDAPRRLEVLFFGAPTAAHPGHDPVTRYRVIKRHLGTEGIDFTYSEDPGEVFHAETLAKYDALLMYGNWEQNGVMPEEQLKNLLAWVENGGAFLPIHCASACYGGSPEFIRLVGGRFLCHGAGVFRVRNVNPEHPIMKGYEGFEAWDETYEHEQHGEDRVILERRGEEPWTWVREHGNGRVFYTAAGHDHRVWDQPQFHELIKRAICWSVGPARHNRLKALNLPKLEEEEVRLPGYRKREMITRAQKPLSPADSMKLAQVPVGFRLSLFASEPDIVNPIHVAWDHRGRAFVIQTTDYPNNLQAGNLGHDKILLCEDADGDGKAEKFTVFADRLSIPTSMVFANGGLICTNGSEMLFLKDTDGDDRADERKVLFSGFGMGDTHAGPSNLRYGIDGWIYATVGYSGFHGTVGGEEHKFSMGVFRFLPDGSKLEFIQATTNNTWGLGINSAGDMLGSTANANPSFHLTHPQADYAAAGLKAPRTPRADEFRNGPDNPAIFNPSSDDIRQVDVFESYTSAAGHSFHTSGRFPESWRENTAFVCDPTGKLVGLFDVKQEGAGYKSVHRRNNIYNSADAWSGPVCAETGPDGALWICDWYNIIIQHNPTPSRQSAGLDAVTGKGNAYETPLRDKNHGRVYRVYPEGSANDPNPGLDPSRPESSLAALDHPNLFWRLQAQRLLVEKGDKSVAPKLREILSAGGRAAPHALHALNLLGAIVPADISLALSSPDRALLRAGIQTAKPEEILAVLGGGSVLGIGRPRELAEALVVLSRMANPDSKAGQVIVGLFRDHAPAIEKDPTLADAWKIAAHRHAASVAAAARESGAKGKLIDEVLARAGKSPEPVAAKPRRFQPDPEVHKRGQALYTTHCIACHGPEGKGVVGAFPPLDGSAWAVSEASVPIRIVLHGLQGPIVVAGEKYNAIMPGIPTLTDQEVSDVLTYVRQSWSNDGSPVRVEKVKEQRAKHATRATPWTALELSR